MLELFELLIILEYCMLVNLWYYCVSISLLIDYTYI